MKTQTQISKKSGWTRKNVIFLGVLGALVALSAACTAEEDDDGIVQNQAALSGNGPKDRMDGRGDGRRFKDGRFKDGHSKDGRDGKGRHRRADKQGRRGFRDPAGGLFRAALSLDSLSAEQRSTVTKLADQRATARQKRGAQEATRDERRSELITAVRAGRVDDSMTQKRAAVVVEQRQAHFKARSERLSALHAALTPEQRQAAADIIRSRMAARAGNDWKERGPLSGDDDGARRGRRGDRARGEHRARGDLGGKGKRGAFGHKGRRGGRGLGLMRLAENLDLTEAQREQVDALIEAHKADRPRKGSPKEGRQAMADCMKGMLEGFASDAFDPQAVQCRRPSDDGKSAHLKQRVKDLNKLLAILTIEQREQLANELETRQRPSEAAGPKHAF